MPAAACCCCRRLYARCAAASRTLRTARVTTRAPWTRRCASCLSPSLAAPPSAGLVYRGRACIRSAPRLCAACLVCPAGGGGRGGGAAPNLCRGFSRGCCVAAAVGVRVQPTAAEWKTALADAKRNMAGQKRKDGKLYDLLGLARDATPSNIKRCAASPAAPPAPDRRGPAGWPAALPAAHGQRALHHRP